MQMHQRRKPLSGRYLKTTVKQEGTVERLITRFRELEDILLLWSIPAWMSALLLWAIGASIQSALMFLFLAINVLVTLLTLMIACLLLLKWIDTLQIQGSRLLQKRSDETILLFALTCSTCALLAALIIITAQTGGGDSRNVLLLLVFFLLGWHYRILLRRALPSSEKTPV